ncbi:Odorant receptor [Sergentomyia squamirostris]
MLQENHKKVKKLIFLYFYIYEMQFIPSCQCWILEKGRLLLTPILLGFSVFCNAWHFLYQLESTENILDISLNTNFLIGGFGTLCSILIVNIGLKENHLQAHTYFENLVEPYEDFITAAREEYLNRNLRIANTVVRFFLTEHSMTCMIFPVLSFYQTNFTAAMFYTFPGIPSSSVFFYPVNIIGGLIIFCCVVEWYIMMDSLFFLYLFYFRGEMHSIAGVAKLLSHRENVSLYCNEILRSIYLAHHKLLQEFSNLSDTLWHFYCHRLLATIFIVCSSLYVYYASIDSSILSGMILQMLAVSLLIILCVPGQLIDDCSETLRETLYNSLWYEMMPMEQRNFIIIFMGAQKNLSAETFAVGVISFDTFVQGMKTAMSYAAFMYTFLM